MLETLLIWYRTCDREKLRESYLVKVPIAHLERAIREAAKQEGREREQLPFETGDEYKERIKSL